MAKRGLVRWGPDFRASEGQLDCVNLDLRAVPIMLGLENVVLNSLEFDEETVWVDPAFSTVRFIDRVEHHMVR